MAPLFGARDRFTPLVACGRSGMAPLIGARDRFPPWVACERSGMAPLIGARGRFTPWVACERSGVAPLIGARDRFTPWGACERSRMAPLELAALGVAEARERIGRGTLSPVALVEACLERIGALDATVQAWVHVDAKGALAAARLAEHAAGRRPLHGIPVAVKDIFDVAGLPTTAGAPPFAHRRPDEDAASVALLRAAGAIVLAKTHTTQLAYRDPAPTRNPWNLAPPPGGSSSGSAAAVAARMVPLALGSQTVGSVLRPAAYCGVVGVKPPHRLLSLTGVIPPAWSLDHLRVFRPSVADAGLGLGVLARRNPAPGPARAPRLALAAELLSRAAPEVAEHVQTVARAFARAGASVTEVKLPVAFAELHAAGHVVLEAEAAAYHARDFGAHAGA